MNLSGTKLPDFGNVLLDAAAFAFGLGCTWLLHWHTTDLVWSLWLSSLVVGYLSILSMLGKGFYIGSVIVFNPGFPAQYRIKAVLIGGAMALFVLVLFSVHFCGFHAIHASFLQSLLPLRGLPRVNFGFFPFQVWSSALHYVMPQYWLFLLPAIVAERRALLGSIASLIDAGRQRQHGLAIPQLLGASGVTPHGAIGRPYLNVLRMHVLIIFLAICHALDLESFPLFATVYAVYFFPWSAAREAMRGSRGGQSSPA